MSDAFKLDDIEKLKQNIVKANKLLSELNFLVSEINNSTIELTLKQNLVSRLSCRQVHSEPLFELKLEPSPLPGLDCSSD